MACAVWHDRAVVAWSTWSAHDGIGLGTSLERLLKVSDLAEVHSSGAYWQASTPRPKLMCVAHVVDGMRQKDRNPAAFLPLRPVEFEILLVLTGGDHHGYAIIQQAEERTAGKLRLETGTLYRALRRLTAAGMVKPTSKRPAPDLDDERRRYFAITPLGRKVAVAEARRMASLVDTARARSLIGEA